MQREVIFRDRQELQSKDLNNVQEFVRDSLDSIVANAITAGRKFYAGFAVSRSGQTQITVSQGWYFAGGPVYSRAEDTPIDLFNVLPLVTRRKVAITVHGIDVESDVQPRDFLVDTETGATEPQSVAMERRRRAEIGVVAGSESPDPQTPTTDALVTVIAYVSLDTSGIVAIEHVEGNRLPNVAGNAEAISALTGWRVGAGRRIDTLATDVANIKDGLGLFPTQVDMRAVWEAIAGLQADAAKAGAFIPYGTDYYLDPATGNPAAAGYSAIHDEGVRFPDAASNRNNPGNLSLYNPADQAVVVNGNFLLPRYDDVVRIDSTGYTGEINISEFTYSTSQVVELTRTRERIRYGASQIVCTNAQYWRLGQYDPISHTLSYQGETFEVLNWDEVTQNGRKLTYGNVRLRQMFVDVIEESYWDRVTSTSVLAGQRVAQTFLWASDGWLSALGLYFSRIAASGNVDILITETLLGQPDLTRVIARTTLNRNDIVIGSGSASAGLPDVRETKIPLPPTFLTGGRRYAVIVNTASQHYLATTTTDNANINGTLFRSTDGGYFLGDLNTDAKIRLYGAQFRSNQVAVEFSSFSLAGGVSWVDLTYETKVPGMTELIVQAWIDNRWQPFDDGPNGADFASLPDVLRLRMVFVGTRDLMPGVGIGPRSRVLFGRGAAAFQWVGAVKTLPSAFTDFKLVSRLEHFNPAQHTCTFALLSGGSTIAPISVEDRVVDGGTIERTATFDRSPGITSYALRITGTTNSPLNPFLVGKTDHYAAV